MNELLPETEHRLCARHIYANWSKVWGGRELKKQFFVCAWSTYEESFNANLLQMRETRKEAADAIVEYPMQCWSRAFFKTRSLCWIVDNNLSESFNAWIGECRYLTIIRMIDGIRRKLMNKWAESEQNAAKWRGNFSPRCVLLFES